MRRNPRLLIVAGVVVVGAVIFGVSTLLQAQAANGSLTVSGTIEATEIHVPSHLGGTVIKTYVNKGDVVQAGEKMISIHSGVNLALGGMNETLSSPINGVVLDRSIEVGEVAAPGSELIVLADLNTLTVTVYLPESRYGLVKLGQTYPVHVDSFPGETFKGHVSHIANQAEFTPRNVQTVDGRGTTVFAITLDLDPAGGRLKPGMPADVTFGQ
jgi:multidrug resistance efflux pump